MPYSFHQVYDAERVRTPAERREADAQLGRAAAAVSRLGHHLCQPARAIGGWVRFRRALAGGPITQEPDADRLRRRAPRSVPDDDPQPALARER